MPHGRSLREIEIKLPLDSAAAGRRLLRRDGFRVVRRRVLEDDAVYDTADASLRRSGCLLRVRHAGRRALLTFKGPAQPGKHKSREEVEMELADPAAFTLILGRLGFRPVFRYQKRRTEFARPGVRGLATLDETPIGDFLELEGAPDWIDRTARRLGFAETAYLTASYARLYLDYCRKRRIRPGNMVFAASRPRAARAKR